MSLLQESLDVQTNERDYQTALDMIRPLMKVAENHPFVPDDSVEYISISSRMERALYRHYFEPLSSRLVKNVHSCCPMEFIWRQAGLLELNLENFPDAEKAMSIAAMWNPASAKYRLMLARIHSDQGRWDNVMEDAVTAMKVAYRASDLILCFRFLRNYFLYKKMYLEAVYCSFVRSNYTDSGNALDEIVNDILGYAKMVNVENDQSNDESVTESLKRFGITLGFNPEVVAVAKQNCEEAFLAGDADLANYFAEILSSLKTVQEKKKAFNIKQLVEHYRNIKS
jgi:tetratricopeptide (TPR) repeat protein